MQRRNFLTNLFAFVPLILGFLGISKMSMDFLTPTRKAQLRKVFASNLADLPINGTKEMIDLKGNKFNLIRTGEKEVKALSTTCTHLGCSVYWEADKNQFYCPCHQGVFDSDGNVVSGPPPTKLDSYETEIIGSNIYIFMKDNIA
ncbi:MAG: ubiquinol-cytochrome c reductase iron-sulfur subunit [Bacteroidota bacterium]